MLYEVITRYKDGFGVYGAVQRIEGAARQPDQEVWSRGQRAMKKKATLASTFAGIVMFFLLWEVSSLLVNRNNFV